MKALWIELIENESGLILSAELILIVTIAVLGLVTGLSCVQQAVVYELTDISLAITALNQSYSTPSYFSFKRCGGGFGGGMGGFKAFSAGSSFFDFYDGCVGLTSGSTAVGYSGVGQSAVYSSSEINSGAINNTAPLSCPAPAVQAPLPNPVTAPCEGCAQGPEVVLPAPTSPTPSPMPR